MALVSDISNSDLVEIVVREPFYKRPFDLAVLLLSHLLLAPLWLVLWTAIPLAIKLDDGGPVFYSQMRIGRGGKVFKVRKFRSMIVDAEKVSGAVWASQNDPRITRVGRFLRHTALDELPQVLNVWTGDMSIVGPRPERPELHHQFAEDTPEFDRRLAVRPGMAGMAQVYGRYDLAPPNKLAHDVRYIESMSLFVDIKLLFLAAMNTLLARWGHATGETTAPTWESETKKTAVESGILPFSPSRGMASDEADEEDLEAAA